jgi:hypothetical protein
MNMVTTQDTPNIITKETVTYMGDKEYTVISIFEGTETASKLLCDMAVRRILNDPAIMANNGGSHE